MRVSKLVMIILSVVILSTMGESRVHADVGDIEICVDYVGNPSFSTSAQSLGSQNEGAQLFTTDEAFVLTGVKIPLYRQGADDPVTIEIWGTSDIGGGQLRPDPAASTVDSTLTTTINSSTLIERAADVTQKTVQCNTTHHPEQVIEFATPTALNANTTYAIVAWASSSNNAAWHHGHEDIYADGDFMDNSNSFNRNIPAEWSDLSADDSGFVVFGNVMTPTQPGDINSWLDNFLTSIGLNSEFGRILAGSLFAIILFVTLSIKGVPWIISLGVSGLGVTFLTVALIFNPAILLGLVAIVMVGGMGLLFALIMGGDRNG